MQLTSVLQYSITNVFVKPKKAFEKCFQGIMCSNTVCNGVKANASAFISD